MQNIDTPDASTTLALTFIILSFFCFSLKKRHNNNSCQCFLSTEKVAQISSVGWIFETMFCKCNTFSCLILLSCGLLHETRGPSVRLNECKNYFLLLWCKNLHMVRQHVAFSIFTHSISSAWTSVHDVWTSFSLALFWRLREEAFSLLNGGTVRS